MRPLTLLGIGLLAVAALVAVPPRPAGATVPAPAATPVVMVRGYAGGYCPGANVRRDVWGGAYRELKSAGWSGPLLPVSFYACDTYGVDITGYGPRVPAGASQAITARRPRVRYDQGTPIERIAHDLAWFVYLGFTRAGRPVDLVGWSLGGLVMRYALLRVRQHDAWFPPYLFVPRAVTISTPHAGLRSTAVCGDSRQCHEMVRGSAFMNRLLSAQPNPQVSGGTAWTVLGSSAGCDPLPVATTLAMTGAERVDYRSPCYAHAQYIWDSSTAYNATVRTTSPSGSAATSIFAPHSLAWLVRTLRTDTGWAPPADPAPPVVRITAPPRAVHLSTRLHLRYAATDSGSGVASYDVRYRVAVWDAGFGTWRAPTAWQRTTRTSLAPDGHRGREYCFEVRARDKAGNVSAWRTRCTSVPLDDRALRPATTGWRRTTSSAAYGGTLTRTSQRGARIRISQVHADRLALVVVTCPTCGRAGVYVGGVLWGVLDTNSATTRYRRVLVPLRFPSRTATVAVHNLDAKPLILDGLAVWAN